MALPHVVTALISKRAELAGDLQALADQRRAIKRQIEHVDATLALFGYDGDPNAIKPRRKHNWMFRRGELQRLVWDIERDAEGRMHREDIAREVIAHKGWTPEPALVKSVAGKVKDVRKRRPRGLGIAASPSP